MTLVFSKRALQFIASIRLCHQPDTASITENMISIDIDVARSFMWDAVLTEHRLSYITDKTGEGQRHYLKDRLLKL